MISLIAHLFDREKCRRLFAEIDAENMASIALVQRLGFTFEGCLREHERTHKGMCDMSIYGLLSRDWRSGERRHSHADSGPSAIGRWLTDRSPRWTPPGRYRRASPSRRRRIVMGWWILARPLCGFHSEDSCRSVRER